MIFPVNDIFTYSILAFLIVLTAGCAVNLLRRHYVIQIIGIAYGFGICFIKILLLFKDKPSISSTAAFHAILPGLSIILACLISMILGFWIFPKLRNKF